MDVFLLLIEESNVDEIRRDVHAFSSITKCYAFLQNKVFRLKEFKWAKNLHPPECPPITSLASLDNNDLENIYVFENQSASHDYFSINIFVKKTTVQ